jgi:3-hydroxybutyryl-CoA dehydrogenase
MSAPAAASERLTVGVVGAGTMGAGIAQACLVAGHEVLLHDVDEQAIERGRARIADGLARLVARGRLDADSAADLQRRRLRDAHALDEIAEEAELVVEAALEDLDLKRTIFRSLDATMPAAAVLATNTSALSVEAIAAAVSRPERVLGLHFFNPAPVMRLVEVVATDRTSAAALERAMAFTAGLGKTPVLCRDAPGFIVNRVNRPFTLEALRMVEEGAAGLESIDRAVESAGYPMGPFRLMDLVGIDVNLAVARSLHEAFHGAPRFRPSPIQERLVKAGTLGRKTGSGFYRYDATGESLGPSEAVLVEEGDAARRSARGPDAIVRRIELAIVNEAYHAVGEGVAEPADIDTAMRLGAAHPRGPFERAGDLGLRAVVEGLQELARSAGPDAPERFRVASSLWSVASL